MPSGIGSFVYYITFLILNKRSITFRVGVRMTYRHIQQTISNHLPKTDNSRPRTIKQMRNRQKEGNLIGSFQGELCGWSGRSRLERLSSTYQFVGQMDRPSTCLHSIRSQEVTPLSLRYNEAKRHGRACPSQTLLIPLGGFCE
jgi:hypothetical protein